MAMGKTTGWGWVYHPTSKPGTKPPDSLKLEVVEAAGEIIADWKKKFIRPAPKGHDFNYLIDLYTRWRGNYFYLMGTFACPNPRAISPTFDTGFARLEYVGNRLFDLAYMRHTGKWSQTGQALSLEACLQLICENSLYQPF